MKAQIDWMQSGKVKVSEPSYSVSNRYTKKYIRTNGDLGTSSYDTAVVMEYAINVPNKQYNVTYYNSGDGSVLTIAWYNSSGSLIGGQRGKDGASSTWSKMQEKLMTFPVNTAKIRIFALPVTGDSRTASIVPTALEGVCSVSEIRVKPYGATESQVVWPTVIETRIIAAPSVVYSGTWSGLERLDAKGYARQGDYAQVVATLQQYRGETPLGPAYNEILPITFSFNPHLEIDGVEQDFFAITNDYKVTASDLGTTQFNGPFCRVIAYLDGVPYNNGQEFTINQEENRPTVQDYKDANGRDTTTLVGYSITLDRDALSSSGGRVNYTDSATFTRTPRYIWNSGRYTYGSLERTSESPGSTRISVIRTDGQTAIYTTSGTSVTFPANGQNDGITYKITVSYSTLSADAYVDVQGAETGREYSDLAILLYEYPVTNGYSIPATGGSVYPRIRVSIRCSVNGGTPKLLQNQTTVADGSTVIEVSGGGISTTIPITYIGAANGLVSAPSRHVEYDEHGNTLVASGLCIRAAKAGMIEVSDSWDVYQQQNNRWIAQGDEGSFSVQAFSVTPKVGTTDMSYSSGRYSLNTPSPTTVTLDFRVTGSGTTPRYTYTTGEHSGGTSSVKNNEPVSQNELTNLSVVSGSSITVTNLQFTAANIHSLDFKDYSVSAKYGNTNTTATATIRQVQDEKINDNNPYYYLSLVQSQQQHTLSAAGGEVALTAIAYYTTGKRWKSDNQPVSGETSAPVYQPTLIDLNLTQSAGYTSVMTGTTSTSRTFKITHRDMTNNVTTDTLSVYMFLAGTNQNTSANPLSYAISNSLGAPYTVDDPTVIWGEVQTRNINYAASVGVSSLDGTDPLVFTEDNPGLFIGDTARYVAAASHIHQEYQEGHETRYTYRNYTSWTSSHDDMNHKELVNTEPINPQTRLISSISASDQYSIASDSSWITLNTSNQTVTLSAQSENAAVRRGNIVVTNVSDTNATASRQIVQNAWASLTASPIQYQIGWRGTDSAIISVNVRYAKFSVAITGGWLGGSIKLASQADSQYATIDPNAEYGNTGALTQYTLRFSALSPNDEEHNPSGYQHERIGQVTLTSLTTGVSNVYISITQQEYQGGLPNE